MNETLKRALKTFFQAAVGYIAANLAISLTGFCDGSVSLKNTVITFFASAIACGLAAVMNLPKKSEKADDEVGGVVSEGKAQYEGNNLKEPEKISETAEKIGDEESTNKNSEDSEGGMEE